MPCEVQHRLDNVLRPCMIDGLLVATARAVGAAAALLESKADEDSG